MKIEHAARLLAGALIALPALAVAADGEWPTQQPISMILPAAPGGSSDPMARLFAEEMGKRLGQSFVIQNRPGAGGNIGMAQAAKARPDGYTIVVSWTGPVSTNLALYKSVGYDPVGDFDPIGMIGCTPNVLAVTGQNPLNSFDEFLQYARKNAGKVTYGTAGIGSSGHIAGVLLSRKIGSPMTAVHYANPNAVMSDFMGGRLDAFTPIVPTTVSLVRAGKMKVFAVMSQKRSPVLPEVPTTAELGSPELISETCFMFLAPKGVPEPVLQKLNRAFNDTMRDPEASKRLEAMGMTPQGGTAAALARYIAGEIPRQAALVKASGAQAQ